MNLEEYLQLSLTNHPTKTHYQQQTNDNIWEMKSSTFTKESSRMARNNFNTNNSSSNNRLYYREKLCTSYSTPTTSSSTRNRRNNMNDIFSSSSSSDNMEIPTKEEEEESDTMDSKEEKNQFLKEISQVRRDILRFRNEMDGLAKQMDGMETDLNLSKDRVQEIEEGLTATQEVNVNLQVLLEKAVSKQKESDVYATKTMRHIHSNLATVVYETTQLRDRLTTIANYQRQHQGSVSDVVERMREYTQMLEQAQGTIQSLQEFNNNNRRMSLLAEKAQQQQQQQQENEDVMMNSLDIISNRNSSSFSSSTTATTTDEDDDDDDEEEEYNNNNNKTTTTRPVKNAELYRHRIIKKRASNPEINTISVSSPAVMLLGGGSGAGTITTGAKKEKKQQEAAWLPQKGLRLLLMNESSSQGLSKLN